jgi:hypothetical protein
VGEQPPHALISDEVAGRADAVPLALDFCYTRLASDSEAAWIAGPPCRRLRSVRAARRTLDSAHHRPHRSSLISTREARWAVG